MRYLRLLSLIVFGGSLVFHASAAAQDRIPLIIDTDANNELDDQHAIAYALFNGDVFDVVGITINRTSSGGEIEKHVEEAERIVKLSGLEGSVPVVRGADEAFEDIAPNINQPDHDGAAAIDFIIRAAHEQEEGQLVLLPIGKLTNIALALEKDPTIGPKVRVVWLGSNYPEPGEHNQVNDEAALNYLLESDVEFEVALVRYGESSGTDAVRVTPEEIRNKMAGKGPRIEEPVRGRDGGEYATFGDYSVALFDNIDLHGDPPSRALFDMAAVAILKNPSWATAREIPAPTLVEGAWEDRPDNPRRIVLWEDFDAATIMTDFFESMDNYVLAD